VSDIALFIIAAAIVIVVAITVDVLLGVSDFQRRYRDRLADIAGGP
jgi:hypothetical protein